MMEQIALPSEMMSQVRRLAFQEKRSVEAVVAEAIQEHLEMMAEAKIDQEIALFEQNKMDLQHRSNDSERRKAVPNHRRTTLSERSHRIGAGSLRLFCKNT